MKQRVIRVLLKILEHATVFVTGGTGSFGSVMVKKALEAGAKEVRVFSRDELKQEQMRQSVNDERLKMYIGDVRDRNSVARAMEGSNLVFHAAALKQVPSGEYFPWEMTQTNIVGSQNVCESAFDCGVEKAVFLSTDKAVHPVNAMGMSKALMEKTVLALARLNSDKGCKIMVTRYGNVMMSRGSVIPKFMEQISNGEPITLTNPEMTRFMMTLGESVDLVSYAMTHGDNGDLFVKKGQGAKLRDVAQATADCLGRNDPSVKQIGYRHGEKKHESLLSAQELARAKEESDFFRVPMDSRSLNYESYFDSGVFEKLQDEYTSANSVQLSREELVEKIRLAMMDR